MIDGLLVEVRADERSTAATAAAAVGASAVPVEDLTPFDGGGGRVDIGGTVYDYTGVDASTMNADGEGGTLLLAAPLAEDVEEFTPLAVLIGDAPAVDVVAVVNLGEDEEAGEDIEIPLDTREERLAWPVRVYDPPLPVSLADDLSAILAAPGVMPQMDGSLINSETLPATPGQVFSADPPVSTDYPEGFAWWQVVDGDVVGFWRLVGGVWTEQQIVTAEALYATNALILALQAVDLSAVNLDAVNLTSPNIVGALIRTALAGNRLVIAQDDVGGSIKFYSGDDAEANVGRLDPSIVGSGGRRRLAVTLVSGGFGTGASRVYILGGSADDELPPEILIDSQTTIEGTLYAPKLNAVAGGGGFVDDDMAGGGVTGASINDNGHLFRTGGSSRSIKENIRPFDATVEQVLAVEPVLFEYRDKETYGAQTHAGFIAEQVDEAGLTQVVRYDHDGNPIALNYDEFVSPVLMVVRHQAQQIADLTARLDALEGGGS